MKECENLTFVKNVGFLKISFSFLFMHLKMRHPAHSLVQEAVVFQSSGLGDSHVEKKQALGDTKLRG